MDTPAIDTRSDLISGVADVRHVPLGDLARTGEPGSALSRVLRDGKTAVAVAAFNSSI